MRSHTYRTTVILLATLVSACARSSDATHDSAGDTAAATPSPADSAPADTALYTLTERGVGPITAGMTIEEASTAVGATLTSRDSIPGSSCKYYRWPNGPAGVLIMGVDNRIARIEVVEPTVPTNEGIRVGATSERVKEVYAGRIVESPHKYTNGTYLTVTPTGAADASYRIVFETDSGKVTRFRAGLLPAVEWVEGCS
jgi:hypothetical protein